MTDQQLHQNILDYRRGSFIVYERNGAPKEVKFDEEYRQYLFNSIERGIAERDGKLVVHREKYTIHSGKIVLAMA